jgi:hypothetical protein
MNIIQGLGLKAFSFKAQVVLGLSIFVLVFPYPVVPEVGIGKQPSVGDFCPVVPGGVTISFDTGLYLLPCCPLVIYILGMKWLGIIFKRVLI